MKGIALAGVVALAVGARDEEKAEGRREVRLTLKECVLLALNHNVDVEIARYQPWIEDRNLFAAFGRFDHVFYGEGSEGRARVDAASLLAGAETLTTEDTLFRTGIRRLFPFGAQMDFHVSAQRTETNSTFALLNPQWQESAGLALTVPVLRDAGSAVHAVPIVLARNARDVSIADFETSLTDAVFAVQEAYWSLVAAREGVRFRREALKAAERLLEDHRRRFQRGVLARVDVTEAEAGVASQVEGILVAENAVQDAMDRLKRLIDPSLLREDVTLVPLDAPRREVLPRDEREATEAGLRDAIERRPEIRQVLVNLESQRHALEKARSDAQPRVDVVAQGDFRGIDDTFRDSFRRLHEGETFAWSVLLALEIPLENRTARGAQQRAELELRRLELRKRNVEDRILLDVREAVRRIKTAERRIEATRKARALAQERYDGEESRREQGLRTTFHVLDAQSRLMQAQMNEVQAAVDYEQAAAAYQRVTATLLPHYDILVNSNLVPRHRVR